jgi:hypothetical protein
MLNYTQDFNTTFECYHNVMDNISYDACYGHIAVIPYHQDIIIVLLVIIAFALTMLVLVNIANIVVK